MIKKTETRNSLKSLKFRNRKQVLAYLRNSGEVSVNDISQTTGLSKMTVHKIIDYYMQQGMVVLTGKGDSTEEGGKKPNLFAFNPNCRYLFAVRLADDRLCTSIVNLKGEKIVGRTWHLLTGLDYNGVMELLGSCFRDQIGRRNLFPENCLAAMVACNGIIDVENGVGLASYLQPSWGTNLPLRESISRQLPPHVPVHLDSWWRHLARGEIYASETSDRRQFFLIGNNGDYISGGLVYDGKVCQGNTGFAGEIGHMVVDPRSDEVCNCGGIGCLEALVAPGRVMAMARKLREAYPISLLFMGEDTDYEGGIKAIVRAAVKGDALAVRLVDEVAGYFAVAINNIIHVCDPGTILLYGDYADAGEYFLERLKEKVEAMSMRGIEKRTRIEPSTIDEDGGVIGAAHYMTDALFAGSV